MEEDDEDDEEEEEVGSFSVAGLEEQEEHLRRGRQGATHGRESGGGGGGGSSSGAKPPGPDPGTLQRLRRFASGRFLGPWLGRLPPLVLKHRILPHLTYRNAEAARGACRYLHDYTRERRRRWRLWPLRPEGLQHPEVLRGLGGCRTGAV